MCAYEWFVLGQRSHSGIGRAAVEAWLCGAVAHQKLLYRNVSGVFIKISTRSFAVCVALFMTFQL